MLRPFLILGFGLVAGVATAQERTPEQRAIANAAFVMQRAFVMAGGEKLEVYSDDRAAYLGLAKPLLIQKTGACSFSMSNGYETAELDFAQVATTYSTRCSGATCSVSLPVAMGAACKTMAGKRLCGANISQSTYRGSEFLESVAFVQKTLCPNGGLSPQPRY